MPHPSDCPAPTRSLPKRPNLEQLKNQAKDLLAAYRAHDADAVAEVERFERKPDRGTFALNDAQRVLVRSYGFASWTRLKQHVDGLTQAHFAEAVTSGDLDCMRSVLKARPELVGMKGVGGSRGHRAIHYAVIHHNGEMLRLLMEHGADARPPRGWSG